MVAFKVKFDGKVLIPEQPVDLPRGVDLVVHVDAPVPGDRGGARPSLLEWMAANPINDDALPADLAHQHDHYLYGTPKKED